MNSHRKYVEKGRSMGCTKTNLSITHNHETVRNCRSPSRTFERRLGMLSQGLRSALAQSKSFVKAGRRVAAFSHLSEYSSHPRSFSIPLVAGLGLLSGGVAISMADEDERIYASCELAGEALSQELWKARHKNVNLLGLEDDTINVLLTQVRDVETKGSRFRCYADRLMRCVIENALGEIDADECVVTTPFGAKAEGVAIEDDVYGLSVQPHGQPQNDAFHNILDDMLGRDGRVGRVVVAGEGKAVQVRYTDAATVLGEGGGKNVLIAEAVILSGHSTIQAIKAATAQGVEADNIIVACILCTQEALTNITKACPDATIVAASLDTEVVDGEVVPGVGNFFERYSRAY